MAGVRARRTRRNKRVNSTRPGLKRKKKSKKIVVLNETLKKNWNHQKTLKQNFRDLGLAYDSNSVVQETKQRTPVSDDVEKMEVENPATKVVQEFEGLAQQGTKSERRIAPGEAQFLWKLIQAHGDNYKAMARDKANVYQHTPNQLKRKCEAFHNSSQDFSKHLSNC